VRPSTIVALISGVVLGVGSLAVGVWLIVDRSMHGGVPFHYWLAPLLALGGAAIFLQLVVMYMAKVGRMEMRSRPPSE
jgi:putative solute:sodium symporter small subunit